MITISLQCNIPLGNPETKQTPLQSKRTCPVELAHLDDFGPSEGQCVLLLHKTAQKQRNELTVSTWPHNVPDPNLIDLYVVCMKRLILSDTMFWKVLQVSVIHMNIRTTCFNVEHHMINIICFRV